MTETVDDILHAQTIHQYAGCPYPSDDNLTVYDLGCLGLLPVAGKNISDLGHSFGVQTWMGEGILSFVFAFHVFSLCTRRLPFNFLLATIS